MLQKKNIWLPFLFGLFVIGFIQKEVIVTWLTDSQQKWYMATWITDSQEKSYETATEDLKERLTSSDTENPLDNCNFVYLDMGTNFGVQIR